ncbi:MAG: TonB-dependent receptor, partial [Rhizorhabdus sp.]
KVAASIAFFYRKGQGYFTNVADNTRCCDYESGVVRGKLLVEPSDNLKITLGGYWTSIEDPANFAAGTNITGLGLAPSLIAAGFVSPATIPTQPWTVAFNPSPFLYPDNGPNTTWGAFVRADLKLGSIDMTSLTGYGERNPGRIAVDIDLTALPIVDLYAPTPGRTWTHEFNFSGTHGPLSWVAGLYLYDDKSRGELYINGGAGLVGVVHSRSWAPFAEANYKLTERLTLTGGLRYSRERKTFDRTFDIASTPLTRVDAKSWGSFTPRATLKYQFEPNTMAYFTYSRGFKSGIYTVTSAATTPVNPEYLTMYELGFKTKQTAFSFNAAAFYYNYSNLQITQFTGAGQVTTNAASARIIGLDVDGTLQLTPDVSITAAGSYLATAKYLDYVGAVVNIPDPAVPFGLTSVSADVSGNRMIRAPKLTVSVSPSYSHEFAVGRISASLTGYYNSGYAHEPLNRIRQGRYFLVNGTLSWMPAGSGLELVLWGRNLTNKAIASGYVAANTADWVVFDPPREIGVSARVHF